MRCNFGTVTATVQHIAKRENKSFLNRLNPANWFKRATYTNLGPLKNPQWWSGLLQGFNKSKIAVNKTSSQSIPAYFRAININGEQVASLPVGVYRRQSDGTVVEETSHPLARLLNTRPHPLYNKFDFFDTLIRLWMLNGQAFVYAMRDTFGNLSRLQILEGTPDIFEVEGTFFYKFTGIDRPLQFDDVWHFKSYSLNGVTGSSPLSIFSETLGRGIAEIEYASSYYGNGAHLSGLLIPQTKMTKEQQQQAVESFNRGQSGPDKIGKVGILPFQIEYKELGHNLTDSSYIQSRKLTVDDIANITGVHPILLANMDSATFSNVEELNRTFVQYTLRAWCKRIENEVNSKAFGANSEQYFIRFNLDGMLRGDSEARSKLYQALYNMQAISPNEVRKLENMNGYDGGDQYGMPLASNIKTEPNADNQ